MRALLRKRLFSFALAGGYGLTLSLFVAFVFRTNNHYFSVSFDNFALVAHRFNRRSYFHFRYLL